MRMSDAERSGRVTIEQIEPGDLSPGEFAHLDGGEQPHGPSQADCEQHNSGKARARKLLHDLRKVRFHQPKHTEYNEKRAGDYSCCVQREMVNHASNYTDGL